MLNDYTNPFNDYTNPFNDYTNPSQDISNAFAQSIFSCIIDDGAYVSEVVKEPSSLKKLDGLFVEFANI